MNDEKREKISFVIPCYNSTNTIGTVVHEIISVMQNKMKKYAYEIILVNDGSPDGTTYDAILNIVQNNDYIKGINLSRNFGQPSAVMAALNQTTGDYIVCGDDDGQTPFNELPKLFEKIEEGYDLVEANYTLRERRSIFRKFGTAMNEGMATWLFSKPKGLKLTTYWVARRFVIDHVIQYRNSYPYLGGLMLRATQKACNVNVEHRKRLSGNSGYNLKNLIELWLNGATSFSVKPLRIMSWIGVVLAFAGILFGGILVINKIIDPGINAGYTSVLATILFLFGILFFFMGLMGEYIGRIFISINNAPQFIMKESVESEKF